jgi:hypothetical protein
MATLKMKHTLIHVGSVAALLVSGMVTARPIPINESARIVVPAPFDARNAAIDGDSILVTARDFYGARDAVFHYRRIGTSWQLESTVLDVPMRDEIPEAFLMLAAKGGVAATYLDDRLIVFERIGTTWVERPVVQPPEDFVGPTLAVDGGRVMVGVSSCSLSSSILSKDASGTYVQTGHLTGDPIGCTSGTHGTGYLSGDFAISYNDRQAKTIYRRDGGNVEWLRDFTIPFRRTAHNGDMDIEMPHAVAGGYYEQFPYRHDGSGWTALPAVSPLDRYDIFGNTYSTVLRAGFLITHLHPRSPDVSPQTPGSNIYVYRPGGDGTFEHVAILHSVDDAFLNRPDASGRSVISTGWIGDAAPSTIFVFDLPAGFGTPQPIHDDFQGGSAAPWSPLPGSQLSIVTSGHSRVYRQSAVTGDAGAMVDGDWTNQAVQADFRPWQFSGPDRWFGLVARRRDSRNFYYVTLRSSNRVSLRKMVNGVITELASAPLAVVKNQRYLVRLEARGRELIATIDGGRPLRVFDASLTHGAAGFAGYRTGFDVDNFSVSPLASTLFRVAAGDGTIAIASWTKRGNDWQISGNYPGPYYWSQPDTAIEGHAVIGTPTDDQIVTTRARIDSFDPASTAGWVGVMNRYVDNRNYYSLVLRSNGNVQLRRTVNGTMTVLAGRAFAVAPGQLYGLRLDAVQNRLRGYVNGVLQLEVSDATFPRGRNGLATSRAAASFLGYDAWQP